MLIDHVAQTDINLRELWSRIAFSLMVSNTDGHLRSHGFIQVRGEGWRLSPAFDMNPVAAPARRHRGASSSAGQAVRRRATNPTIARPESSRPKVPGSGTVETKFSEPPPWRTRNSFAKVSTSLGVFVNAASASE